MAIVADNGPNQGLSPRGRGNPLAPFSGTRAFAVYPRVGGETPALKIYPTAVGGLSPRGRGNRTQCLRRRTGLRSIPAWAGKPCVASWASSSNAVYPRVGGETKDGAGGTTSAAGLSPRGRGNPLKPAQPLECLRSIPAWAGKPAPTPARRGKTSVYPRVGGETPYTKAQAGQVAGLSPRGRGNHMARTAPHADWRSIPAWAGKPLALAMAASAKPVYPRVGGETP